MMLLFAAALPEPRRTNADSPFVNIDPGVVKASGLSRDGRVSVLVELRDRIGSASLVPSATLDRIAQRRFVVDTLRRQAARVQTPLLSAIAKQPEIRDVEGFWAGQVVALNADLASLKQIALRPDVANIRLDRELRIDPTVVATSTGAGAGAVEKNISQIKADLVWNGLATTGRGTVVAIIDTGVDVDHPALRDRFRGRNRPPEETQISWYVATGETYPRPVDTNGHGTHVAGIAVGSAPGAGIGVAPGAEWIAAKAFNAQGTTVESVLHRALQWVLAPGGDATNAPDVVNNSWTAEDGSFTGFHHDVLALRAAGILAVFAAGNSGPFVSSVGAPASDPAAFAVGAVDSDDVVGFFSSRGPSPFGPVKPEVVAPGVAIRSAKPGGDYQSLRGTSMAAPHVSGAVALLRSLHPAVPADRIAAALMATAKPLGQAGPNNDYGAGRIDVLRAAMLLSSSGVVNGQLFASSGSLVRPSVSAVSAAANERLTTAADPGGAYRFELLPGTYNLTASALGFRDLNLGKIDIHPGQTITVNGRLDQVPSGAVVGRLRSANGQAPVAATVATADQSFSVQSDPLSGRYRLTLPAGSYELRIEALGFRIVRAHVEIVSGQDTLLDRDIEPVPRIGLVESGAWYNDRRTSFVLTSLEELGIPADRLFVTERFATPTAQDLRRYDLVIWLSPQDGPGLAGGELALSKYLAAGGRLLLSGQDIGFWDGGGSVFGVLDYYKDYLHASWIKDDSGSMDVSGAGPFEGVRVTLNHPDSARNQRAPDEVAPADARAATAFYYANGKSAGVSAATCLPYRTLYLGFGIEGVGPAASRTALLHRAIDWLISVPDNVGVTLIGANLDQVVPPGRASITPATVWNTGKTTDTLQFDLGQPAWDWSIWQEGVRLGSSGQVTVGPCQRQPLEIRAVPSWQARPHAGDSVRATFRSLSNPAVFSTLVVTTHLSSPVLLVQNDRWIPVAETYRRGLINAGIDYDLWDASLSGMPTSDALSAYGAVLWWSGYNWYDPVSPAGETAVAQYLESGGRAFVSSQDYLNVQPSEIIQEKYFGLVGANPELTATAVAGVPGNPIGNGISMTSLHLPYPNFSDVLTLTGTSQVAFVDGGGLPLAVTKESAVWRSAFLAFGLEGLPSSTSDQVIAQTLRWFGPLIGSTLRSDRSLVRPGERFSVGIQVENLSGQSMPLSAELRLPVGVAVVADINTDSIPRIVSWATTVAPKGSAFLSTDLLLEPGFREPRVTLSAFLESGNERATRVLTLALPAKVFVPIATKGLRSGW